MEPLTQEQQAAVTEVLRRLRAHFHEWTGFEGCEHDLVGFAYYEEAGDTPCCGDLLAEAAPVALGAELVARHGFTWVSLAPGRLGVTHPALTAPIDLASLESGAWCDDPPRTPTRGEVTHGSLAGLLRAVGGQPPTE